MKIILDESVPERLAHHLPGHDVKNVRELGIKGIKNGKLLLAVESGKFDVFISADQNMLNEQNWSRRLFATLLLSTNNWKLIRSHVEVISQAVHEAKVGEVRNVFCGRFVKSIRRGDPEP